MKPTQKELAAQEALRTEQEQYVSGMLPTGTAEHHRDMQETKIVFPSGAKIAVDWAAFEKGEAQCLWLGYPLPAELRDAFGEWGFKTLFLSQENDDDIQDALHEILTMKDKRFPGKNIYHYPTQRDAILAHAWTEGQTKADDIYAAWLKNARAQITGKPEAAFVDQTERESFVKKIPGFTPKKGTNNEMLRSLGINPASIADQVVNTLRKAQREKERKA